MLVWALVMLCPGGIAVRLLDKSFISDLGVGYDRNRIIQLETGTEPKFWLIPGNWTSGDSFAETGKRIGNLGYVLTETRT